MKAPATRHVKSIIPLLLILQMVSLSAFAQPTADERSTDATFIPQRTYSSGVTRLSAQLYNDGTRLLHQRMYDEAVEKLQAAVAESRGNVDAWDHLGICFRRMGMFERAVEAYETSMSLNPLNPVPYANLGLIFTEHLRDYDRAASYYRKLSAMDAQDPEGPYGLARVSEKKRDHAQAIKYYLAAAELYRKRNSDLESHAYLGIGMNFANKRPPEPVKAVEYFRKAKALGLELAPEVEEYCARVQNQSGRDRP